MPAKTLSTNSGRIQGKPPGLTSPDSPTFEDVNWIPLPTAIATYVAYGVMLLFAYMNKFIDDWFRAVPKEYTKANPDGYAPLFEPFEYFYTKQMYGRVSDCFNRPIDSMAGAWINVWERRRVPDVTVHHQWKATGTTRQALNLGSYNYLGFAVNEGPITEQAVRALHVLGPSTTSSCLEAGYTSLQRQLEQEIAEFVGKEAALVFGMGYGTNSTNLPGLLGAGDLVISDANNHASLVTGCRTSAATVYVFRHNDVNDLRRIVRSAIIKGQPRTGRAWNKIIIVVEGVYSMEGDVCNLPEVIQIKKDFRVYLYVDEAHSIGALGPRGRGIVDYWGCDPADVDILMGTFTKSFGSVGGYVASSRALIESLRHRSYLNVYGYSMPAPAAQQALTALRVIQGKELGDLGQRKLRQLKNNSNYFRLMLRAEGFRVFGAPDSPVIPAMFYHPQKIAHFSRLLLSRGIAVVVVAFPATPATLGRARFCISASHTKEDLDFALAEIRRVGDVCRLRYHKNEPERCAEARRLAQSITFD